jgi:sialate O-acetylesterase
MRRTKFLLLAAAAGLWLPAAATADVKPHPLFSDHMVLQRGRPVPVWGTAAPGETIQVTVAAAAPGGRTAPGVAVAAVADAAGKWRADLPGMTPGTGLTLTIKGTNTVELKDVAVGDVWLCSGQSNMEWKLTQLNKEDQGKKVAANAANPNIRLFTVPNRPFPEPQKDFPASDREGKWLECKPEAVINFSAVGYFFGRDVQKAQNVPVGLIAADWGGTPAEAWTSRDGLYSVPELQHYVKRLDDQTKGYDAKKAEEKYKADLEKWKTAAAKAKADGKQPPRAPQKPGPGGVGPHTPAALYNGMIAPLLPFPIAGAIWYQGESNAGRAAEYYTLLPTMIRDWRRQWGYDFPFLIVQLAPFRGGASGVDYAELRDAQFQTTRVLGRVGIAVITDAGDETDIHPQEKEPVGARLALAARRIAYGENVEHSGPVYKSLTVTGNKAVVAFDHAAGLKAAGDAVHGFTVSGADGKYHPAKAVIEGNTVVVTSDKVEKPVAVRYGWVNFAKPELNLFNTAGLPAVPFRTDNFPLTTAAKK